MNKICLNKVREFHPCLSYNYFKPYHKIRMRVYTVKYVWFPGRPYDTFGCCGGRRNISGKINNVQMDGLQGGCSCVYNIRTIKSIKLLTNKQTINLDKMFHEQSQWHRCEWWHTYTHTNPRGKLNWPSEINRMTVQLGHLVSIWWFVSYEWCHSWHQMSSLRPGIIEQH